MLFSCRFGSVESSEPSSHFHDSAASMSPPEARRQTAAEARGAKAGRAATAPSDAHSDSQQGSSNSSAGSHASSACRQIAVSANGASAHWNGAAAIWRLPQQMPPVSGSGPETPEWMDRSSLTGNMSAIDSSCAPTPLAPVALGESSGELGSEEDAKQHGGGAAAAALRGAEQQQQQQQQQSQKANDSDQPPSELFGTWACRQKHFPRQQVHNVPSLFACLLNSLT